MKRLSYEESCAALQKRKMIGAGAIPALPDSQPRHDDAAGRGIRFVNTVLAHRRLENLTLPRTFFGRSEIRRMSFKGSDLSGATANWNDFVQVNFSGADFSGSDLRACLFERVRFVGASLAGVDFRYCGFKRCDFKDADLTDAKLTRKAGAALRLTPEQQSVIDWQAEDGIEPEG
jgi:uncharacterized protein YjbI with pentapeptide repeats